MGYNNNNAGMRFMRYKHYAKDENLEYYDKLAEEEFLRKRAEQKVAKEKEEKAKTLEPQLSEKTDSNQVEQKSHNSPFKYGREYLVDIHHFLYANHVNANIMIYAMKKKKDIVAILNKVEDLMKRDIRINPSPKSQFSYFPKMDNAFRFLSILAEELDCTVNEIMCDDEFMRREFAYDLLDSLQENDFVCDVDDGYAELTIDNFDFVYDMTPNIYRDFHDRMSLTITKKTYDDGEVGYALSFGSLLLNDDTKDKYMVKGAYIWEEDEGHLKDFTERIIGTINF